MSGISVEFNRVLSAEHIVNALLREAITVGTEECHREMARRVVDPPKTGRVYPRKGGDHQASAPGESPANDTGALVESMTHTVHPTGHGVEGVVEAGGGDVDYAVYLELGTTRMRARPYAVPAFDHGTAATLAVLAAKHIGEA